MEDKRAGSNLYPTADVVTKLHPYFGFLNIPSDDFQQRTTLHANNFGSLMHGPMKDAFAPCCDFPMLPENHSDLYFIAVFGNSIAQGIGLWMEGHPSIGERPKKLPNLNNKRLIVLNPGVGRIQAAAAPLLASLLLAAGMKFDLILYFTSPYEALAGKANGLTDLAIEYPTRSTWESLSRGLERLAGTDERSILGIFFLRAAQNTQRRLDRFQIASWW